jgi:tetratricopeptide (TPR) repeat protein
MSHVRAFKQKLSTVNRLWEKKDYDTALAEVEELRKVWPGNAHLHILWASLVQLQEDPKYSLHEAKKALQQAVELDESSPAGAIELAHFLDAVEDNPQAASKSYTEGVAVARQLLIEGLMGQAKALLQLGRRDDCIQSLMKVVHILQLEPRSKRKEPGNNGADIILRSLVGQVYALQLKGPFAEQIEEILNEALSTRSV